MTFADIVQTMLTLLCIVFARVAYCVRNIFSSSPLIGFSFNMYNSPANREGSNDYKSTKQITYESTIIISNIQMLVLMLTVLCFAVALGYIQGMLDPEAAPSTWTTLSIFSEELDVS